MPQDLMKVSIRGRVFASVFDAAKHLKVQPDTVYKAVSNNRTDRLGLGKGARGNNTPQKRGGTPSTQVTFGRFTFTSINEAGRQLGFAQGTLSKLLREDTERSREVIYAAVLRYEASKLPKRGHHDDL
jgi:hypothetical protein